MRVVLNDLTERGKHRNAAVLELRGAVPLHLLGGAVLTETQGVEHAAALDIVPDNSRSLDRVWHYGPSRGALGGHLQAAPNRKWFPFPQVELVSGHVCGRHWRSIKEGWRTVGGIRKKAVASEVMKPGSTIVSLCTNLFLLI